MVSGVEIERLSWDVGLEDHKIWLRHGSKDFAVRLHQTEVDDWLAGGRAEDVDQLCRATARQLT